MKKLTAVFLGMLIVSLCAGNDMNPQSLMQQLETIFPQEIAVELLEKKEIKSIQYKEKDMQLYYYPRTQLGEEALTFWKTGKPVFTVESLYLLEKKEGSYAWGGSDIQYISEILRSISTLQGIEYYSNTRGKMHTLYEVSYVIDTEKSKNRLPDPVSGSADGISLLALQKDTTFGTNIYRYTYKQTSDAVAFFSENVTGMRYMLFEVVKPGNLTISLVVTDIGDALVSYALIQADFLALPAIENKLSSSFSTRADAIYNWFITKYEEKR